MKSYRELPSITERYQGQRYRGEYKRGSTALCIMANKHTNVVKATIVTDCHWYVQLKTDMSDTSGHQAVIVPAYRVLCAFTVWDMWDCKATS